MKRKRKTAKQRAKAFEKFGRLMFNFYRARKDFFGTEESLDVVLRAVGCGLVEEVRGYDPAVHGEIGYLDPGDSFWRWTP